MRLSTTGAKERKHLDMHLRRHEAAGSALSSLRRAPLLTDSPRDDPRDVSSRGVLVQNKSGGAFQICSSD